MTSISCIIPAYNEGCPFRKLYSTILMVKSAQDGAGDNGIAALDWPMIRGILAQPEMSSCRVVI